jgi:hypothetical protein
VGFRLKCDYFTNDLGSVETLLKAVLKFKFKLFVGPISKDFLSFVYLVIICCPD